MNGLNTLIKGQINRADTITKCYFLFCKKPTLSIKSDKLKVKGWRKIYHTITNQKKARITFY